MMRRILAVLLCISLMLSSLPLTVLGTEATDGHEHSYSSVLTEESTCTREGVTTYTCTCGDSFTQNNPTTAHIREAGACLACGALEEVPVETEPVEATAPEQVAEVVLAAEETSEPEAAPAEDFRYNIQTLESGEQVIAINAYYGSASELKIPQTIEDLPVRIIGASAFSDNSTLQRVFIPEGVTEISDGRNYNSGAFYSCSALESVTLPASLKHLGKGTFYRCTALKSIQLPEGLETLGANVFYGCSALESISLPAALQEIPDNAFYNCSGLTEVELPASLKTIGSYAFYNCQAITDIALPDGLETIENYAFSGTGITKLELPDSVTSVSLSGLSEQLTHVRWTAGIPEISRSQFQEMRALETVILPEGVTKISDGGRESSSDGWNTHVFEYGAFRYCTALKSIELPSTLTYIGAYAFDDCTALESINLDTGVTEIGTCAFSNCSSLKEVNFHSGLQSIGSSAFYGCAALQKLQLPDTVITIESNAFSDCSALEEVLLPASLKTIGSYAFYNCQAITDIALPDGLETIESYAFCGTGITKLELPDSVTSVSLSGLSEQLTHIRWTAGIPEISRTQFQGFGVLKTVILPEGVTEIADGGIEIVQGIMQNVAYDYGPFLECYSLESIVLPDSLTKIGRMAFYKCSSLSYVQFGKNVSSVGSEAFRYCADELTLAVHPGSWGEQYALENEYEYVYVGANGAVEVTVDPEVYRGMQLVLTCGNTRRVQTISDQNSYTFTGLSVDSTCTVQIRNAYGDIVAQAEDLTVTGSTSVTLEDVLSLGTVSVVLLDENGSDITSAATVEWYGADNEPYASGASLRGLAAGTTLRCRIRLSEQYGQTHQLPEDFVHIVKAGEESLTIRLIRIPTVILSGTVTGKNGALAGASVVVSQTVNGKYSKRTTVLTDKDGRFSAAVLAVGAQMTVSARGCLDQTVALENLSGSKDLGTLTLTPVTGAMLTISAAYIHSALQGETARTETLTDLNDLEFAVYNKTQNASVETVLRQDMMLVLADHASAGDRLEVTVSSLKGDFQPTVYDVTLEKSSTTNLLLELKQSGSIIANFSGTDNEAIRALIYHDNGNLVWSGSAKAAALSVTSGVLADGSYTVVMMGRSSFLDDPNSLEGLRLAGMMEGTDYVKRQVRVTSGLITVCEFDTVPLLDETRFYYTAPDVTGYTTSKTSITAGKFFTLRASAAFTEEYEGRISDVKWIFELPEGTEYYEGTLTLGGTGGASCEYSGNVLTVPTEDPAQIVRFCVNAIGQGDVRSAAYLEFICDGQLIRQPVGTVNVKISALDFEVTEKTYEPSVTVTGTASGNAEILVYDNDILVGQTQSNPNGSWQLTFDLYKPGTYTEHRIYAVMRLSTGTQVRSVTHSVIYQYAPDPVSVSTVTMFFGDSSNPAAVFDFKDPQIRGMAYTVVGGETFTFLVDFHCEDDSLLSDVSLELKLTDGSTRSLKTVYDEAMGGFVTSSTFSFDALPVNVSVGYVYDGELVFSQEHLAEVEAEIAELEKAVDELDTIPEEDIEALFAPIVLDFNSEVEVPEELTRAVADYNAALSEYQAYAKELSALMEELYGEIEVSQNKLTTDSELFQSSFEQRTLAEFSVADKVAEGYSVYLVGEGTEEMVLVRITTDTEAGCVEYSVIDATDDGSGIARMARNPQAARELPKDLVIEAIPAKKGEMYISSAGYKGPVISNPPEKIQITFEDMAMVQGAMGKAFAMMEDARLATSYGLELYAASQSAWCEKISKELAALPSNSIEATVVKQRLDLELAEKNGIKLSLENSKMLEKTFDVVGKVATGVGAIFDYSNLQKEALKCGNLIYAANTTNNPEIVEAMYQQFFKTYTLGVISIGNVVWGEKLKVDSIPVSKIPGCNTLLAFVDTIVDDIIFKDVNDNIDRVYEKYSGNNASGSGEPMRPIIDPSGYIYEAVASNRLQGVTVTCYEKVTKYDIYDEAYTEISMWDAEEFDQRNPLTTDALGQYSWDVPTGWWRVKAELEGYETTYSEWLPVPPPQLEVNLGLVSYEAPVVQSIDAAPDAIEITFSKYMRAELLTAGNITVSLNGTRVAGELTLVNGEENPLNADEIFASIVRFVPETEIANGSEITVTVSDKLVSYADVTLVGSKSQKATVIARPDTFIADATSEVDYLGNGTVTIQALPADLAAGQTVQVAAGSGTLLQVEESTVVLDANGCAEVHITGKLPGETEITFTLSGTKLKARTVVTILMPEIPDCTHKNLATDSVREITQCQNNGDSRTHYCVGTETFRLYCQDCGEYISGVHQGVTYPYIQRIDGDYSHEFLDGICTDCGYESHILLGDANDDGTINNIDAMLILQYAVGLKNQADLAYAACDVNGDNMVNNIDAMLVLQYAVGLITVFPGGTA